MHVCDCACCAWWQVEHLARHVAVDLFLDTLQYGAHTTAADALFMGVPIVSLPGECRRLCKGVCT